MPVPHARAVVTRTLLRDRAYEVLRDAIVDGTLAPGEQLREHELQEWIGVSRTPVREALMRLERAGLVSTRPGHSTSVVPLDDVRVDEAVPVVAAMHALAARGALVDGIVGAAGQCKRPRCDQAHQSDPSARHVHSPSIPTKAADLRSGSHVRTTWHITASSWRSTAVFNDLWITRSSTLGSPPELGDPEPSDPWSLGLMC
ncbi:GntR family transcriptional regulator [Pseudoclavibacter helvolus]|uniref:GntR family transcriptional regulator n=1 Tax=Pseudoclavibacter helvolus TaxID=255205 RepID=UPI0037355151